jgi:clan AA aspartic protease (TIGR02281 family)
MACLLLPVVKALAIGAPMRALLISSVSLTLAVASNLVLAKDFEYKIPITQQNSGNYYVAGTLENDDKVEFLVDTGAGMVILAERTFKALTEASSKKPSKRIAVRMADGRTKAVNVYTLNHLVLGQECNVGPLEVAVIPGAANNILGLNVLKKAAPFAIYTSPPSLALSACTGLASGLAKSNSSDAESLFSQLASQQSAD